VLHWLQFHFYHKENFMKSMFFLLLLSLGLVNANPNKFAIQESSVFSPRNIGKVSITKTNDGFMVNDTKVHNYDIDPLLKKANKQQLVGFLKHGYIAVKKMNNGDYTLKAHTRGNGGGYFTGLAAGWAVRAIAYGTAAGAVGGIVVATGPLAVASGTLAGAVGTAVGGGAAAGAVGGAIAAGGLGVEAGAAAALVIAEAGGLTAAVAAIETVAVGAQIIGTAIWWLP
jgi:hypothetical protein